MGLFPICCAAAKISRTLQHGHITVKILRDGFSRWTRVLIIQRPQTFVMEAAAASTLFCEDVEVSVWVPVEHGTWKGAMSPELHCSATYQS